MAKPKVPKPDVQPEAHESGSNKAAVGLVAEAGADGNALATDGAAAAEYGCAGLGLHAGTEAVCLDALAPIGLKCALGHGDALLFPCGNLRLNGKIQV